MFFDQLHHNQLLNMQIKDFHNQHQYHIYDKLMYEIYVLLKEMILLIFLNYHDLIYKQIFISLMLQS